MDSFTSDDFKDLSSVRQSANANDTDSSDFNISVGAATPKPPASPPSICDGVVDSMARCFEKSAEQGLKHLQAEDSAFKDPTKVAALLHARRAEPAFRSAARATFGAPVSDGLSAEIASAYVKLASGEASALQGQLQWLPLPNSAEVAAQSAPPDGGPAFAVLDIEGHFLFLFDELARATLVASVDLAETVLRSGAEALGMATEVDTRSMFGITDAGLKLQGLAPSERRSLILTATSPESRFEWMGALSAVCIPETPSAAEDSPAAAAAGASAAVAAAHVPLSPRDTSNVSGDSGDSDDFVDDTVSAAGVGAQQMTTGGLQLQTGGTKKKGEFVPVDVVLAHSTSGGSGELIVTNVAMAIDRRGNALGCKAAKPGAVSYS